MPRPLWVTDFLIVVIFAVILAVLSVVNIRSLQQNYNQTERLQTVNQVVDCFDPTTSCGKKVVAQQAAEREFFIESMRNQAICTLLTSRTMQGNNDMAAMERVYNECVMARATPPPELPEPLIEKEKD